MTISIKPLRCRLTPQEFVKLTRLAGKPYPDGIKAIRKLTELGVNVEIYLLLNQLNTYVQKIRTGANTYAKATLQISEIDIEQLNLMIYGVNGDPPLANNEILKSSAYNLIQALKDSIRALSHQNSLKL